MRPEGGVKFEVYEMVKEISERLRRLEDRIARLEALRDDMAALRTFVEQLIQKLEVDKK